MVVTAQIARPVRDEADEQAERPRPRRGRAARVAQALLGIGLVGGGVRWRGSLPGVLAATAGGALVARSMRSGGRPVVRHIVAEPLEPRPSPSKRLSPEVAVPVSPSPLMPLPAKFPPVIAARLAVVEDPLPIEPPAAAPRLLRSLAGLGTVLGAIGAVAMPFGMLRLHQGDLAGDLRGHIFDVTLTHTTIDALWMYLASAAGAGLAFLLLIGSVGALAMRRWARPTLLLWAWSSLLVGAVGCAFYPRWLFSSHRDHLSEVRGVIDSMVNFGGWGLGTALAVALLILLTRPSVRMAFTFRQQALPSHSH